MESNLKFTKKETKKEAVPQRTEDTHDIASGQEIGNEETKDMPDSLRNLIAGLYRSADCVRPFDQTPDWLDMEKLRRGQKFAQDYLYPIFYAIVVSLPAVHFDHEEMKPLIFTGRSGTPYTALKRYLSTILRFRRWFTQNPWDQSTAAAKDIMYTRSVHDSVRRRLNAYTYEEIESKVKIENAWCPALSTMIKDISESRRALGNDRCFDSEIENHSKRSKNINQTDMMMTQWSFTALIILYPKSFGIHCATDEDLEGYCHLWRSLGYQLGIEDEYNFCRGTLDEVRQRGRDCIDLWVKPKLRTITPEWEHMLRCLMTGLTVLWPLFSFDAIFLHLTKIFDIKMPRFYARLSYTDWMWYNISKILLNYVVRIPGVHGLCSFLLNVKLDQAEKFTPEDLKAIEVKLSDFNRNDKRVE